MSERRALTEEVVRRYRRAGKKEKGGILETTGYQRKYAIHLLNTWGRARWVRIDGKLVKLIVGRPRRARRRQRPRRYDQEVLSALKPIWYVFDCMCGKRLVVVLRTMLPLLESFGGIELSAPVRAKLQTISAATIDRLLQHERARLRLKGRTHTGPNRLPQSRHSSAPGTLLAGAFHDAVPGGQSGQSGGASAAGSMFHAARRSHGSPAPSRRAGATSASRRAPSAAGARKSRRHSFRALRPFRGPETPPSTEPTPAAARFSMPPTVGIRCCH